MRLGVEIFEHAEHRGLRAGIVVEVFNAVARDSMQGKDPSRLELQGQHRHGTC